MMKQPQPYLPLYVQDVLTDPNLAACSAAACGLYLYLLCLLHKQEEYGTYRLWDPTDEADVIPLFAKQLSRQTPLSADEIEPALRELLCRHVLLPEGDCLYHADMVKQSQLRAVRVSAGKKGGSKTQSKTSDKTKSFACTFALAKSEAKYENEIEIENENEYEQERIEGVQGEKGEESSNGFEAVWAVYPRRIEKAAARKAYDARLRDGWSRDELLAAAQGYAALCQREKRESRYIKHAAVFFGTATPFVDYLPRGSPTEPEDDLKDCF